jgi:hypothetical protein
VRLINRLCDVLGAICPALERAVGYSVVKGLVVMLTEYQTPAASHRIGVKRTGDQPGVAQGPGGWRRRSQDGHGRISPPLGPGIRLPQIMEK